MKSKTKSALEPKLLIRIVCANKVALGPGKVELLELLEQTGSISEAARQMRLSYMKAWLMTKSLKPLVRVSRGGRSGGGATVTDAGRETIRLYRLMESNSRTACEASWSKLQRLLVK